MDDFDDVFLDDFDEADPSPIKPVAAPSSAPTDEKEADLAALKNELSAENVAEKPKKLTGFIIGLVSFIIGILAFDGASSIWTFDAYLTQNIQSMSELEALYLLYVVLGIVFVTIILGLAGMILAIASIAIRASKGTKFPKPALVFSVVGIITSAISFILALLYIVPYLAMI